MLCHVLRKIALRMKILKTPYAHLLLIYLPILIVGIALALFIPPVITLVLRGINWLFLLVVLFLVLSPYGKNKINNGDKLKKYNYRWLGLLFCLQIGLGFIFFVLVNNVAVAGSETIHLLSIQNGLFPWPIYLLFSISFAHFSTKQGQLSTLKESLRFVLRSTTTGPVGAGADMLVKQALLFSCAITFSVGIAQISQSLCQALGITMSSGVHLAVLFLGTLIFLLMSSRISQSVIHKLWHKQYSLKLFLPQTAISLILVVVIFNGLINWLTSYTAPPLAMPFHLTQPQEIYWQLFIMLWWLGWTPLIGYFLAQLAQGKSLRTLLLCSLILPIIFSVLSRHINYSWQAWPITLLINLISLALITIFFRESVITNLFDSAGTGKNTKQRMSLSMTRNFLFIIALMLVIYLLLGIPIITLPALAITGTAVVAISSSCLGYLRELKK
jgi:choline-glycine betaine transporter